MHAYNPKSSFILSAIRNYIRLLVVTMVILSCFLIGYIYWNNNQYIKLDEIADHYHLETMLYCAQIKEEILRMLSPEADDQIHMQRTVGLSQARNDYANTVYLIEKYIQAISRLHEAYGAAANQAVHFEPIIRKAGRQLARIKIVLEETAASGIRPFVKSETSLPGSFVHTIEQLRRLHAIARGELDSELTAMEASNTVHLLTILTAALLLGSLVIWRITREIRRLVETQRKTESILRQSATVFESASEGVVITDVDANIIAVNKAFTDITGFPEKEVLGKNPRFLKSGQHDREFYEAMWSSLLQHGEWKGEISGRRRNGDVFPKWQTINAVRDDEGRLTHYVSIFLDISQLKESEEKLNYLAHHDALTGLPNRLLLNARLEHSLQQACRKSSNVAVLFLDLDHFKKVNDSLGHTVGDHLLQLVAKRLLSCVREEDTIARMGGDELAIVLGSLDDVRYAATSAQKILDELAKPFEIDGRELFMSASIGISTYPRNGRDATALLKNADAAMYMAKSDGRNGYHFYSNELSARVGESFSLETNLYRALEREELFLHFQPQVSLKSGSIIGVEALVRWQHPELGLVSPARFIPLAEENGLIGAIGKWVLHTACAQAKAWQNDGLTPVRIAVNLSGRQLEQDNIVQEVHAVLEDTGLDPSYLELELTESSVMKRAERAVKTLDALRELGMTIAIDDFGTGYSSLSYLKRFPVDRLKIDRSFVRDIPQDANDVALARAIVALGHSLKLSVVAEGVETHAQRELLTSIGCDEMQGFLYSKPGTASEMVSLLSFPARSMYVND